MKGESLFERLSNKFIPEPTSGCWLWIGSTDAGGYGQIYDGKLRQAHVVSYEMTGGTIPPGMELDHLCRVRCCVNPVHLEPVTHSENAKRGNTGNNIAEAQRAKTHCPGGHLYDDRNTYRVAVRRKQGVRVERHCRACHCEVEQRRRQKGRVAIS